MGGRVMVGEGVSLHLKVVESGTFQAGLWKQLASGEYAPESGARSRFKVQGHREIFEIALSNLFNVLDGGGITFIMRIYMKSSSRSSLSWLFASSGSCS